MSRTLDRKVVQVRKRARGDHDHVSAVVLDDDTIVAAPEVVRQIGMGVRFRQGAAMLTPVKCRRCGEVDVA